MPLRVIVTRPAAQAAEWVDGLRGAGVDAAALPLIQIVPAADLKAVRAAWAALATRQLVVFVSPNAALQFFAARGAGEAWPATTRAASPGPGTTRVLTGLGVAPAAIVAPAADAAQFDSESLWRALAPSDWRAANVLIVRGDGGRDWLADTLRAHGAHVDTLGAYRRLPARLDAAGQRLLHAALECPAAHCWLFSSSEAIDHLQALQPASAPTDPWPAAWAIATHPRIAARARQLGIGRVSESRPALDAVVACIQSARP